MTETNSQQNVQEPKPLVAHDSQDEKVLIDMTNQKLSLKKNKTEEGITSIVSSPQEISQRMQISRNYITWYRIYKPIKRISAPAEQDATTSLQDGDQSSKEVNKNTNTQSAGFGKFQITPELNKVEAPEQIKFQFQMPTNMSQALGEGKNPFTVVNLPQFASIIKLNSEKKFTVNKDLFTNTFISDFNSLNDTRKDNGDHQDASNKKAHLTTSGLVQVNSLSSSEAIKNQKLLTSNDSPIVKSLFDFKENASFKPLSKIKDNQLTLTENPFQVGQPSDQLFNLKPMIVTKLPTFHQIPIFTLPGSNSAIFTSGKSLFETSDLGTIVKPYQAKSLEDIEKADQEQKNEESVKVEHNSKYVKMFQRQVESFKILKGIQCDIGKKDNGFLSIERLKESESGSIYHLVFRNFIGASLFSGMLIGGKCCKIKEFKKSENKYYAKVAFPVKDLAGSRFQNEHLIVRFNNSSDQNLFIQVFEDLIIKGLPESQATQSLAQLE